MDEALEIGRPVVAAMDRAVEIERAMMSSRSTSSGLRERDSRKRAGSVGCRTLTWP
jgi:hypothetical protein